MLVVSGPRGEEGGREGERERSKVGMAGKKKGGERGRE